MVFAGKRRMIKRELKTAKGIEIFFVHICASMPRNGFFNLVIKNFR